MQYLSGEAEAERLLYACEDWLKPIVLTTLHTGMRKGELLGLTLNCVDMTHGFIRLKQTKNGKARELPFNVTLWGLFSGLRTRLDVPWVLHDTAGHLWDDVRHGFERACTASGLTDFHFHDLRPYLCFLAHYARSAVSDCKQPSRPYVSDHDPPLCPSFTQTPDFRCTSLGLSNPSLPEGSQQHV